MATKCLSLKHRLPTVVSLSCWPGNLPLRHQPKTKHCKKAVLITCWERTFPIEVSQYSSQTSTTWVKLVCDVFRKLFIIPQMQSICDEVAAGPKSTDHVLTILVTNLLSYMPIIGCIVLLFALPKQQSALLCGQFDEFQFIYLTVGHLSWTDCFRVLLKLSTRLD